MYSLHRPIYLKGRPAATCPQCAQKEAQIRTKPASPPRLPPQDPPAPITNETDNPVVSNTADDDDDEHHLPVLISRRGVTMVYPHEATRDVLTGKIPYYYADETGCTRYEPMHMFHALRMKRKDRDRYGEYPVVGGHQRFLPRSEKRRSNFRRRSFNFRDFGEIYGVSSYGCIGVCIH